MGDDRRSVHLIPASMLGAMLLLTLDLIKGHRSNFWTGLNLEGWLGAGIAFVAYAAALTVVAYPIDLLLRMAIPRQQLARAISALGAAAALVGWALLAFVPGYSIPAVGVAAMLLLAVLVLNSLAELRGWAPQNGVLNLAIASCGLSWIAMETVGVLAVINPDRHLLVTVIPACIAAILFQIGFVAVARSSVRLRAWIPLFLFLLAGAVLTGVAFIPPRAAPPPSEKPSFLLVTCDALRADSLSAYGGDLATPHMASLADDGVIFERAYALAPWTLPSVNALYGSQYPNGLTPGAPFEQWRSEVTAYAFDDKQTTLAQRLSAAGYATALFTGNGLVGQAESTRRGFDTFVRLGHHLEGWTGIWAYAPYFRELLVRFLPAIADIRPVDTTQVLTAYTNQFLRANQGRPVFVWLHYMDPHSPYDPPDAFRTGKGPWPLFCPRNPHWGTPQHEDDGTLDLTDEEAAYVRMLYEGEVRYVDESLGRVLEMMNDTGHASSAIVCLTADHGEELWDHGKWGHGHTLYDEVIRVPLVLRAPGIDAQRIQESVSHIDMMPTIAELLGIDADPNWVGLSLANVLRQEADPPGRPAFARATNTLSPEEPFEMVAVNGRKLIHGMESDGVQLFDLEADPNELNDLESKQPNIAGALAYTLRLWNLIYPGVFAQDLAGPDAVVLEELQALGYVN